MPREYIDIGGTPAEEDCAQTGITENYEHLNRLECRAYIMALRRVHGDPPAGAEIKIHVNPHEMGSYREVRCVFDPEDPAAVAYADKVGNGLARWRDARMSAPVQYDERSQPLVVRTVDGCLYPEEKDRLDPEQATAEG
jgi:hypothetical protein